MRELYQQGTLAVMLPTDELIRGYVDGQDVLAEGTAMFGGTCAAIGGIRSADRFEFSLEDPVLNRRIESGYDVCSIPSQG